MYFYAFRWSRGKASVRRRQWKFRLSRKVVVWSGWGTRTTDLVLAHASDIATKFHGLEPQRPYTRKVPHIIGASTVLADEVKAHLDAGTVLPPQSGIAVFAHATVAASGVVLSADGRVVSESLTGTQDWASFGAFIQCPETFRLRMTSRSLTFYRRFKGAPRILLRQAYDANYGHWLIDCLPCLAIIAQHFNLAACRFIVSRYEGSMPEIYRETLTLCGIDPCRIEMVGWEHVHVDTLVYPLPITRHPWVKSPAIVEFLEGVAARITTTGRGPSRIYVSRNKGRTRRLLNEDKVLEILRRHDFAVVHPEVLSFADQVRTFRDAEIVVGNCGAALTNVVFCPRGVVLLALTTQAMQDDFFWDLIDLKYGTYMSLHGQAANDAPTLYSDFTVDTFAFDLMLQQCFVPSSSRLSLDDVIR